MPPRLRSLVFVIHHLNPWGGHERSTLEIVRRLSGRFSGRFDMRILTYSMHDLPAKKALWGEYSLTRVRPEIKRPALLMILYFMGVTLVRLFGRPSQVVHATGACSLVSDVVQVQFISASWRHKKKEFLKLKLFENPMARLTSPIWGFLLNLYHQSLLLLNIGFEKLIYRRGKTYIVLSDLLKKELQTEFGIREKIHVVHHGVDPDLFCPPQANSLDRLKIRSQNRIEPQDVLILFAGEYERKGLCVVLHVLARLPASVRAKVKLLAVGGGSIEGFKKLASSLGLQDQAIFLPHQKNIAEYYRAADLFLLPTYYEPFGLVILEAMACGLPVIATGESGACELIEDGVSGFKIKNPSDIAEIIGLLGPLVESSEQRTRVGAAARKVAEGRSWDQVASEYESILRPLLEGNRGNL